MSLKARLLFAGGRIYWRLFKPLTIGVRLLLVKDGRVLLVKHSYQPQWYLPGGGVKKMETLQDAARREAWEEVGARLGELEFVGIYSNLGTRKSDHIALFLCREFEVQGSSDFEIERFELFPISELPGDVSEGTRRRIQEYMTGSQIPVVARW